MEGENYSEDYAERLLDPEREKTVPADQVIRLLELDEEDKVIDLGSGNGYLTIPIAEKTKDRVVAVDYHVEMLNTLAERAEDKGLDNVDRMPSDIDYLNFPDSSFQKAVSAFVLYEVDNLEECIAEIYRVVTEEGKLLVLEWEASESEEELPPDTRIPAEALEDKLQAAGFTTHSGKLSEEVYYIEAFKEKKI